MKSSFFSAPTPAAHTLEVLRQLVPQAIETDAQGRIRVNAGLLQLALDPSHTAGVTVEEDGFELRWVGKREAYHSAFVPVQKVLHPLPQDSSQWDSTGHVLIKGDNLDALRLLRQSYFGKVKLIYIDPPYNTQSDAFIYRDDFSVKQSAVLAQLGYTPENIDYIKNIYGARTHSGWLSFMYPRLLLAKDLLRDDGVIFMSIDDNEQAPLKLLCDEVFGQENFVAHVLWQKKYAVSNDDPGIGVMHDHILVYQKTNAFQRNLLPRSDWQKARYTNPDNDPRGPWAADNYVSNKSRTERPTLWYPIKHPKTGEDVWPDEHAVWRYSYDKHLEVEKEGRLYWGKDFSYKKPRMKRYLYEVQQGVVPSTWWTFDECGHNDEAQKETADILDKKVFSTPKPIRLIDRILNIATAPHDLILDFFAGSGTTGEAVMRLNAQDGGQRRFILVQIPQAIDPKKQKDAHHFVTHTLGQSEATIFEITAERLRRAGARLQAEHAQKTAAAGGLLPDETPPLDTGFRVFELVDDPDALMLQRPLAEVTQADLLQVAAHFSAPQSQHLPRVLYNLLLAEGLPLSSTIETIKENCLYRSCDVLFVLHHLPIDELTDILRDLQQQPATAHTPPLRYLSIYAPWVADDNFMLGLHTVADTLGFSEDKLRLRG